VGGALPGRHHDRPLSCDPATESAAKVNREFALLLTLSTALWVTAALVLVDHWWSRTGIRLSAMDPPGRLLAAAVATLPDHRREWGMAMHAELAEVQGRSARYLPPANAVFLAAVLAGCVWIAVAAPRSLSSNRLAPHLGVAAAVVLVVGQLLLMRAASYEPRIESQGQQLVDLLAALWFWFGPATVFFVPAFAAGSAGRSFRAGLQAGIWAGIAALPLTYALWLHEALRLYAINGGLLWFGDGAPEGENLSAALFWTLRFAPLLGLPFAVIGAAIGAGAARPPAAQAQHAATTVKP
jgi:hypothetical protein